jgi:hypothetical protein
MAPGDHAGAVSGADSHWVRWHQAYEDPSSGLSQRRRTVQSLVRAALDELAAARLSAVGAPNREPIRIVSLCAGQGRDVIDVVATHPSGSEVSALLVELDPSLAATARANVVAAGAGMADRVRVIEADASQASVYAETGAVPADLVLVCGVFGNISDGDITATIQAMRGFCFAGGQVIWTRHRRPPDLTPVIRADFAAAGFTELDFVTPERTVMAIGRHRLHGPTIPFDPDQVFFDFVGDGHAPV